MDDIDRAIVNALQGGFPVSTRPFAAVSQELGLEQKEILHRLRSLLEKGVLTRFGPMYDAERLGGAFTLCAMRVPAADFARVAALVNAHPEVAHNYEREHRFNMWFVLATRSAADTQRIVAAIEQETGCAVMQLPRLEEYFVELRLSA
jgi:DNA-binding Lrp family transcriptional regulator